MDLKGVNQTFENIAGWLKALPYQVWILVAAAFLI